jgi:hypothetical protein
MKLYIVGTNLATSKTNLPTIILVFVKLWTIIVELNISKINLPTKYRNIMSLPINVPKSYAGSTKSAGITLIWLRTFSVELHIAAPKLFTILLLSCIFIPTKLSGYQCYQKLLWASSSVMLQVSII